MSNYEGQECKNICKYIRQTLILTDGTPQQNHVLNQLIGIIPKLPNIYQHNDPRIDYQEAFNQALINIAGISLKTKTRSAKNIRSFAQKSNLNAPDSTVCKNFVNWFNRILKRRIYDLYQQLKNQPFSLDNPINAEEGEMTHLDTLASNLDMLDEMSKTETFKNHQKTLQESAIFDIHPHGYPNCTCRELIKRRKTQSKPQKWKAIATELKVPIGTVTAFWNRKCQPLLNDTNFKE
ncbi:MAG TPA: hypothetical protein V6C58_28620 [Allocoleopsis sp.]